MRIGCLGAARITPAAIVKPAQVVHGVVLQAIASRDPGRGQIFANQHGFARVLHSYDELINRPDVDLVYNALPINLHAEWTIKALRAGKHVLCEKPFAMNTTEAEAMLRTAKETGKRVIEAFHYRYHPAFSQMLDWISADAIGKVETVEAEFTVPIDDRLGEEIRHRPDTGGGAFMDLGCYPLNWTLALTTASPISVTSSAQLTSTGVDESLSATIEFGDGMRATLRASMAKTAPFAAWLKISGTKGNISFVNPLAPQFGASLQFTDKHTNKVTEIKHFERISTYTFQLDAVVAALKTGEPLPSEGENTLRQQRLLDQIYAAAGLERLRHHNAENSTA